MKKIIFVLGFIILAVLVYNRAMQIAEENARVVFNPARANAAYGTPVEVMKAKNQTGFLRAPVAVRGGQILAASTRVGSFRAGQSLSNGGRILSVSRRIDLDTGLFAMRTNSPGGNYFVLVEHRGVFVPLSAISGNSIMVAVDGYSAQKQITVAAADIDTAVVRGLSDGDIIILTKIATQVKIRIIQR